MDNSILQNKQLYKIDLFLLKLLPVIMACSYVIAQYAALFNIGSGPTLVLQIVTHYLGLTLAPMLFMFISSKVFQFCTYHRMFIYYILTIQLMNVTNWYFKVPISNLLWNSIQDVITIGFFIAAIIMYIKKRRQTKLCKKENPT
jgi:hypothetical protein